MTPGHETFLEQFSQKEITPTGRYDHLFVHTEHFIGLLVVYYADPHSTLEIVK